MRYFRRRWDERGSLSQPTGYATAVKPDGELTREQIERGTAALIPFVEAWNLPLNPENLDELAYAVLTHGQKTGPIDPAEWDAIDGAVREQLTRTR